MSEKSKIEATLWKTADKLCNKMDAAEHKQYSHRLRVVRLYYKSGQIIYADEVL